VFNSCCQSFGFQALDGLRHIVREIVRTLGTISTSARLTIKSAGWLFRRIGGNVQRQEGRNILFPQDADVRGLNSHTSLQIEAPAVCNAEPLDLAVVLPTYNERDNVALVIARLEQALRGLNWEAIFVDDDSPDGTAEVVAAHARANLPVARRIRLIHRIGRRGLSSACIEGMLLTSAPCVAVMDADLQHDETVLPRMLDLLRRESLDVVVGTRNAGGGSMGQFGNCRVALSQIGKKISHAICCTEISDPMSGFFIARRGFFLEVVHQLQGGGFKILIDMLSSARRHVRIGEVGYTFGVRQYGESKLNVIVGIEYLFLILNKKIGSTIPVQLAVYLLIGSLGLVTHLLSLFVLTHFHGVRFVPAQIASTFLAMIENFYLNNAITFRDRRFQGVRVVAGAARFVLACSFGAWANIIFARALVQSGLGWFLAGLAGIVLGSVWNLSISSLFTWQANRPVSSEDSAPSTMHVFSVDPDSVLSPE
jgi:dolichol-phosphate mannosyltransferase